LGKDRRRPCPTLGSAAGVRDRAPGELVP
jgi:hypothetical protein